MKKLLGTLIIILIFMNTACFVATPDPNQTDLAQSLKSMSDSVKALSETTGEASTAAVGMAKNFLNLAATVLCFTTLLIGASLGAGIYIYYQTRSKVIQKEDEVQKLLSLLKNQTSQNPELGTGELFSVKQLPTGNSEIEVVKAQRVDF